MKTASNQLHEDIGDPEVTHETTDVPEVRYQGDQPTIVRETRPIASGTSSEDAQVLHDSGAQRAQRRATIRARYGGMYWGSAFIGFAVATFFLIVFLGIVGAIVGAVGFQLNAPVPKLGGQISQTTQNLGIGALAGSVLAVFFAFLIGGYTAGRMSRFDGAKNGAGVWLWTIIVAALVSIAGAILGSSFNVASQIHLKIDITTLTVAGAISLAVTLVVMLVAATLGGIAGERYHRRIDRSMESLS